jgi:regulator of protease activity HflC (stomatin/prohibitin superfamily)
VAKWFLRSPTGADRSELPNLKARSPYRFRFEAAFSRMTLEEILTNRNRLIEEILHDVKEASTSYGVAIRRADVKDIVFPGNLQEIMNRVLAAQRNAEAQLVEARTRAEVDQIQVRTKADSLLREAEADTEARRLRDRADVDAARTKAEMELELNEQRQKIGEILANQPALLRLQELETLRALARNGNARIYIGFEKHWPNGEAASR